MRDWICKKECNDTIFYNICTLLSINTNNMYYLIKTLSTTWWLKNLHQSIALGNFVSDDQNISGKNFRADPSDWPV